MIRHWMLDERGEPQPTWSVERWAAWYETAERHVGKTTVGDYTVSTVFLGTDMSFGEGPPVLWETMIHSPDGWLGYQQRYTTRDAAEAGHRWAVEHLPTILAGEPRDMPDVAPSGEEDAID